MLFDKEDDLQATPAEETILFIKESLSQYVSVDFWMQLQICIDKEVGRVSTIKTIPLSIEQEKEFGEQQLPEGKYVGKKIKTIFERDKRHLMKMSHRPSLFQLKLRRYLLGREARENNPEKTT